MGTRTVHKRQTENDITDSEIHNALHNLLTSATDYGLRIDLLIVGASFGMNVATRPRPRICCWNGGLTADPL